MLWLELLPFIALLAHGSSAARQRPHRIRSSISSTAEHGSGDKATAYIPVDKVRGVNLGSWFVIEPWLVPDTWKEFGCSGYDSERACNSALGLDKLQAKYEEHWDSFYSQADFYEMKDLGLNTIRLPLPYWTVDSLIAADEAFARGSMKYVKQAVRWAKNAGLYVIMDLHAAPGRQTTGEPFTGDVESTADFFDASGANYERAYECLRNWTTLAHTDNDFSTVVMIQVVNEPLQDPSTSLTSTYYPGAQKAIREAETSLGVTCGGSGKACLTIQFMDDWWGAGHPTKHIDLTGQIAFDDHLYAQFSVPADKRTRKGYFDLLCTTTRPTDISPVIMGEWSLSTIGGGELDRNSDGATGFFQQFAAAQIQAAEKGAGWTFWVWKSELNSSLWEYRAAVAAGYIPRDLSTIAAMRPCSGY